MLNKRILLAIVLTLLISKSWAATIVHYDDTSLGFMPDQPFIFDSNTGQLGLTLGLGYDNYNLSFDIETNNIVDSLFTFRVLFDTPTVQTVDFHGSAGISTFNSSSSSPSIYGNVGSFDDNVLMHVEIDVDLSNNLWTIDTGLLPLFTGTFYADDNDVNSIRLDLSAWNGGATPDSTITTAIDNLVVSSTVVPVPAAIWLFGSGLFGLLGFSRLQKFKR